MLAGNDAPHSQAERERGQVWLLTWAVGQLSGLQPACPTPDLYLLHPIQSSRASPPQEVSHFTGEETELMGARSALGQAARRWQSRI